MLNQNNIRNFSIISHINHGKSTLADRFLEVTGAVSKEKMRPQYLDMMDLEKEKGITIKMQPVRMEYQGYILNLIDTPGHADFNYEVSRSLAAVEGVVLLVSAVKGVQSQTLVNLELAKKQELVVIPLINKIDSAQARTEETTKELAGLLKISEKEIIKISAKYAINIEKVLEAIIEKIPAPKVDENQILRALIFDSQYDHYKGVIAHLKIVEGRISPGDKIYFMAADIEAETKEVGYFNPQFISQKELKSGEIGYLATGIKDAAKIRVGDTIIKLKALPILSESKICNFVGKKEKLRINEMEIKSLPGYKEPQPVVFLSIFPQKANDYNLLKRGLEKLKLNDASLFFKPEQKEFFGQGFQCGFLGLLHTEIVVERLKREFGLDLILSTPSVIYKILTVDNKEILIYSSSDWQKNFSKIKQAQELWARLQILVPLNYLGAIIKFLADIRAEQTKTAYLEGTKIELTYKIPLREIITKNFYDKLKSISQGFASMSYEVLGWQDADLVNLDILISGKKEAIFSLIVPRKEAYQEGKRLTEKLKQVLPPQLFSIPIQAAVEGKIIARETIKAKRKDVTAPLYGGDYTRKKKLLEQQKKGKKMLKEKGKLQISPKTFLEVFRTT